MSVQALVMHVQLEDLSIEAVLDKGFCGESTFTSEMHTHAYYELIIQTKGQFVVELSDGTQLPLEDGCICLIPPGQYHSIKPGTCDFKKLAIRFHFSQKKKETPSLYAQLHNVVQRFNQCYVLKEQYDLQSVILSIKEEFANERLARKLYLNALLTQFFLLFLRNLCINTPAKKTQSSADEREARRFIIEEYLDENCSKSITQEDLAKHLNLSLRQLSRVLESSFSTTFRQLLIEIRMNRAAQLLRQTELSVEEVAYAVGYCSLSGFCYTFRKVYGLTASNYRKQNILR